MQLEGHAFAILSIFALTRVNIYVRQRVGGVRLGSSLFGSSTDRGGQEGPTTPAQLSPQSNPGILAAISLPLRSPLVAAGRLERIGRGSGHSA